MSAKPIEMSKLRTTLRLHSEGKSKRFISSYLGLSRNTVKKYIDRFRVLRVTFEVIDDLDDIALEKLFIHAHIKEYSPVLESLHSFFPYAEKELRKTGVTRHELWKEYKGKHPEGLQRSQFCHHFNGWQSRVNVAPVMHLSHKAGDKLFVDYAGKTLEIVDQQT